MADLSPCVQDTQTHLSVRKQISKPTSTVLTYCIMIIFLATNNV